MNSDESTNATLQAENRRLRAALTQAHEKNAHLARENEDLIFRNEELAERSREAHAQMRLMRASTSWKAGAGFRYARRMGGKVIRNLRRVNRIGN